MVKELKLLVFMIALAGIMMQCKKNDKLLKVDIVVGEPVECRNGLIRKLTEGQVPGENDTLIVAQDSKLKLTFGSAAIYLNCNSKIKLSPVVKQDNSYRLKFYLIEGELYFSRNEQRGNPDSFIFNCQGVSAAAGGGSVYIKSEKDQITILQISGSTLITSLDTEERLITSCSRLVIKGLQKGQVETISQSDVAALKSWVGNSAIDAALSLSKCTPQSNTVKNLPPEWVRLPDEVYMSGELVIDTVEAIDPENGKITYQLLSGPDGMVLDNQSGELKFKPAAPGSANVTIKATDSDSQSSVLDHFITISSGLAVLLNAPRMVNPNEKFTISASPPKNMNSRTDEFSYRFDCNGDGIFEFPGSEKFGKSSIVKGCSFPKEGIYLLKVEIKDNGGKTASSIRKVLVNRKPEASLKITPLVGTVETDFLLDAGASSDSRDSSIDLMVRFDVDNDGNWDIPSSTGFINEKRANCNWSELGKFKVVVQVIDKQGMTDTASAEVIISRGIKIDYITCPDTIHVGDTIRIECKYTPSEFTVKTFEWSFDSDSNFEVSINRPVCTHLFKEAGVIDIRCRVTDEKGLFATQQKKVIIVNSNCIIDAGGPYKTNVNTPLLLKGIARDPDNKILKYFWDFDGDGISDWSSEKEGKVTHVFSRAGSKKLIFSVMTDDSARFFDSASVQVSNTAPVAKAGEDIVSKSGKKVKLNGVGEDKDSNIIEYRWDFDNDGKIDWTSKENGIAQTTFQSFTTAVFSVLDSDSATSYDSIRIVICPEGMQLMEQGKYCIDTYEYPNKKGELPEMNVTYSQAKERCRKEGKRLCSPQEWENACRNEQKKNEYPYGKSYIKERCNTLGNPVLKNKVSESGYFYDCRGDAGVLDMSGNAAEWTETENGVAYVYGGSWQSGENESTCGSKIQLAGGGKYFYVGFRCCK